MENIILAIMEASQGILMIIGYRNQPSFYEKMTLKN
jgi:hypothetical protein